MYYSLKKITAVVVLITAILGLFSGQAKAQESFESKYLSGHIIEQTNDENGRTLYITELSNGTTIDMDTFGINLKVGTSVFVEYFEHTDTYNFSSVNRNQPLLWVLGIFIMSILLLTRKKGLRSLVSLSLSIILLFFGLVPLLLQGYDPIWITLVFGLCVLFLSIFVTHGFNYQSLVSFLGSFASVLVALLLLWAITHFSSLTGLINDEIQFLAFETQKVLNLVRIVSASIIIGILGVLDDITITQVAVVRELSSDRSLSRKNIFIKALRVGRDHISSLVNTLVFAYVGATLPMIMFIALLEVPFWVLISQEFIYIEIIRSLVGAIALTLAVPLTTYLATHVFMKSIHKDSCTLESACAHHHH